MKNETKMESNPSASSVLETCFVDITAKELSKVVGRDEEIERMVEVLSRRDKNNPILVGEAGVGKTSVVYGLANRIRNGNVPSRLKGKKILMLDASFLANNLQYIKSIFNEVKNSEGILFIDEIHNIVGAGRNFGSLDVSNIMKPLLTNGDITCIGATTYEEYHKSFESDAALDRRFQKVEILEPSIEKAIEIVSLAKGTYESYHNLTISEDAVVNAVKLSKRYIADRQLPDSAFDLIDEAASRLSISNDHRKILIAEVEDLISKGDLEAASKIKYGTLLNLKNKTILDKEDITHLISDKTKIPVSQLTKSESDKLVGIEDMLKKQIVGQDQALTCIADAIRTTRVGIKTKNSSFLFLGPSGCGKTETAKVLAKFLFDDEDSLIRLDMSEYGEKHMVSRLIGASAGYVGYEEGGILTNAVKRKPYSILLLDEVEKAHADVWNIFLQVLDDGRLTDGQGKVVDFSNTVIIMTSNLKEEQLKTFFRPEFLNRIDEIVTYNSLTKENIVKITDIELKKLADSVRSSNGIEVMIESSLREALIEKGYSPEYGARPLKRAIHKLISVPLSNEIINGNVKSGELIILK